MLYKVNLGINHRGSIAVGDLADERFGPVCYKSKDQERKGNVIFNDTLNTFYLRLYAVGHMVKDHSDRERKPAAAT